MSLHHLAKQLETQGRGKDTELIHVSKNEMQGLQALARAKGGNLTRNPHTGLYEAGFLEDVLPMVAAAAAIYFTAGAATPAVMGATGLGATGAGILAGAGAGALISGGMAAIQGKDVGNAALMGGVTGAITGGLGAPGEVPGPEAINAEVLANAAQTNLPVQASNTTLTGAAQVNPISGELVDPFAGLAGTTPTPGSAAPNIDPNMATGYSQVGQGINSLPSSVPNQPPLNAQQIANLKSTDAYQLDRLASQRGVLPEGSYELSSTTPGAAKPPMTAGERIAQQQADAVAKAQADPKSSWWSKQTPFEKAGYTTAGAGLLAAMNRPQPTMPTTNADATDDGAYLSRISPNFQAQQPVQPNPYYRARYPVYPTYAAEGGIMRLAQGGMPGPVERMTQNVMGGQGNMYPLSQQEHTNFATPTQMPTSAEVIRSDYDTKTQPYTGVMMANGGQVKGYAAGGLPDLGSSFSWGNLKPYTASLAEENTATAANQAAGINTIGGMALQQPTTQPTIQPTMVATTPSQQNTGQSTFGFNEGVQGYSSTGTSMGNSGGGSSGPLELKGPVGIVQMAYGGIADLGSYSDGGRLLKGPGDGVSDNIPATIGGHQPARLADGEFVIPARIVSELGNGSTDAGAKRLYAMMERVQAKRKKSMGKGKFAVNSKAEKDLPV